jgi:UDP-N-acetylmuramate dehydrogenase
MDIQRDVSLMDYSTMRLGGNAAYLTEVATEQALVDAVAWADEQAAPIIIIGQGSNIVWNDGGFPGLIIVNKISGFATKDSENGSVIVTIGAGEIWDSAVERTVAQSLHGIEALSLIPGTAGATPVQNVGAYGQEIADTLVSVEAYDRTAKKFISIPNTDCGFSYRGSRFKAQDKNKLFITRITLELTRDNPKKPFYKSLQTYFDEHGITEVTPHVLREAVIAIRTSKLPDPAKVANNGSFFQNPVIPMERFMAIQLQYPDIAHWEVGNGHVKISAGWLLEKAGFKDIHDSETGMATWPKQSLVLVNEHAKSTADLLKFRQKIIDKVQTIFGITLMQEPELIGEG